jgi:hypothetical protein
VSTSGGERKQSGVRQRHSREPRSRRTVVVTTGVLALIVALTIGMAWAFSQAPGQQTCRVASAAAIVPADGTMFGVNLDWEHQSVAQYRDQLTHPPAAATQFSDLPYDAQHWDWIASAAIQARSTNSVLLLTLEPNDGLAAVTDEVIARLVTDLRTLNDEGTPVVLRYAHEMNGTWYAWSQQPDAYIASFRKVAAAVHQGAPGTAMMWAPNYGGGYPFTGGAYLAKPGTKDFAVLDTNHDGKLTMADDPYLPYYPGDGAVDWVGMSVYHWGNKHPWGANAVPEPGKFTAMLTGTYNGSVGDETAVPDFYAFYAEQHQHPMAVTETAAFYAPARGGDELAIKQAWWQQVFAADIPQRFPQLKMINWFEWNKHEVEVGEQVDWRALGTATTRDAFVATLPSWLVYGGGLRACG